MPPATPAPPAIAGTLIVVLTAPLYWLFYRALGLTGLAVASDAAILIQTATLAILLHKRRLVSLAHIEFAELGRALLASLLALAATWFVAHRLPAVTTHRGDLLLITAGSATWAIAAFALLTLTGSKLPKQLLRRGSA